MEGTSVSHKPSRISDGDEAKREAMKSGDVRSGLQSTSYDLGQSTNSAQIYHSPQDAQQPRHHHVQTNQQIAPGQYDSHQFMTYSYAHGNNRGTSQGFQYQQTGAYHQQQHNYYSKNHFHSTQAGVLAGPTSANNGGTSGNANNKHPENSTPGYPHSDQHEGVASASRVNSPRDHQHFMGGVGDYYQAKSPASLQYPACASSYINPTGTSQYAHHPYRSYDMREAYHPQAASAVTTLIPTTGRHYVNDPQSLAAPMDITRGNVQGCAHGHGYLGYEETGSPFAFNGGQNAPSGALVMGPGAPEEHHGAEWNGVLPEESRGIPSGSSGYGRNGQYLSACGRTLTFHPSARRDMLIEGTANQQSQVRGSAGSHNRAKRKFKSTTGTADEAENLRPKVARSGRDETCVNSPENALVAQIAPQCCSSATNSSSTTDNSQPSLSSGFTVSRSSTRKNVEQQRQHRRNTHNAVERRRRETMNRRFDEILSILPPHLIIHETCTLKGKNQLLYRSEDSNGNPCSKLSRLQTLKCVTDYIHETKLQVEQLQSRIRLLERILTQNGIEYRTDNRNGSLPVSYENSMNGKIACGNVKEDDDVLCERANLATSSTIESSQANS